MKLPARTEIFPAGVTWTSYFLAETAFIIPARLSMLVRVLVSAFSITLLSEIPQKRLANIFYRRDLLWFIVSEARNEHAAEFAGFSGIVDLHKKVDIERIFYSELFSWERQQFDSVTNALARYHQSAKKWILIEAFSGGIDGRRAVTQSTLIRRYMSICNTWRSTFRLALDVVFQLAVKPVFLDVDLVEEGGGSEEAIWDVLFSKLSLVQ